MKNIGIKYIFKTIKLIYGYDKHIFLLNFIVFSIGIFTPFISVYFSKFAVEYLSNPISSISYFVINVCLFLGAIFFIRILSSFLSSRVEKRSSILYDKFNSMIMTKCMNSTYQYILDKDFIEKKALAINAYKADKLVVVINDFLSIASNLVVVGGMAYIMKQFSYIVLIALTVVILINIITTHYTKKANYQMDVYDTVFNVKTSYLRGIANDFNVAKEIRLFGMERGIETKMKDYSEESHKKMKEYYNSFFIKNTLIDITGFIFNVIIYLFLGYRLLVEKNMTLSEFVFMIGAVTSAYGVLQTLTNNLISLNADLIYVKDFYEFLNLKTEVDVGLNTKNYLIKNIETIEIKNLSFKYPDTNEFSIRNLSVTFEAGKTYMIVGENGAGKSTLIKLLLRFYDDYCGEILINGIDIKNIEYSDYLNIFSVLFQDFNMLSMPIVENISPTDSSINYNKINDLLNATSLSTKIETLNQGINTYLYRMFEKDGVEFSGGEMQKLAIIRALYKDSLISIFDEPSSALDIYSEQNVLDCINNLKNNRIVIYTTHRLNSKNIASEIIVIHNGSILEKGTHEQLIELKGLYHKLFSTQAANYMSEGVL